MQFGQMLTHDVTQSASITTRMFDIKLKFISTVLLLRYFICQAMVRQFDVAVKVIFDFQNEEKNIEKKATFGHLECVNLSCRRNTCFTA